VQFPCQCRYQPSFVLVDVVFVVGGGGGAATDGDAPSVCVCAHTAINNKINTTRMDEGGRRIVVSFQGEFFKVEVGIGRWVCF
jgi:hypothetical protein